MMYYIIINIYIIIMISSIIIFIEQKMREKLVQEANKQEKLEKANRKAVQQKMANLSAHLEEKLGKNLDMG